MFLLVNKSGRYAFPLLAERQRQGEAQRARDGAGCLPRCQPFQGPDRDKAWALLAQGIDPVAHRLEEHTRKKLAAANTFEAVAREWWEDVHRHEVSTGQAERNRRRLELHVYPHLATDPIAGINAQRLLGVLRRLERRGIVATAHRTKDVCSQVFEFAIATVRADANPAKALGRRALRPRCAQRASRPRTRFK